MRSGNELHTQSPKVPESAYKNPDGIEDLYQRVQAMSITDVVALHQRWESIRNRLERGLQGFAPDISKAMEGRSEGAAAKSAADGIKEYVDKSSGLVGSVQIMAEKVKIIRSGIEVTRPAVQEAPGHTWTSDVASRVPGPTWKLNQHREDAAHDASVNVVKNVFYPAVREADTGVPLVPKPYIPIQRPGDLPTSSNHPGQPSSPGKDPGGNPTTLEHRLPGTEDAPENPGPADANPLTEQQNPLDQTATAPAGTNPSTQPANTTGTDPSPTRPGTPSPGSPDTPGPSVPAREPRHWPQRQGCPRCSERRPRRRAYRRGTSRCGRDAGHDAAGRPRQGR
ncbi:hypothetical protein OH799_33830 [Nocardia sp. NBC_00881]|uniref:hypothetical protein n=1 Tax=Nocardia sp. NBC_00881 TaxID=2975995 RepID=UPI00386DC55E|nr:hypothetical protein OH799_33830 [Nocardia sp. NBC_00881]